VAADTTQDGTEQEQHGQQEDAAVTELLGHHTDAAAAVTKQFVFLIDNILSASFKEALFSIQSAPFLTINSSRLKSYRSHQKRILG